MIRRKIVIKTRRKKTYKYYRDRRNVYLGKVVPDVGKPGLDKAVEVYGIANAIIRDVLSGKISYDKGIKRLNFLALIVSRDKHFTKAQKERLKKYLKRKREELKRLMRF